MSKVSSGAPSTASLNKLQVNTGDLGDTEDFVAMPMHRYYPVLREDFAYVRTRSEATTWPTVKMANKEYILPVILFSSLEILHILDELSAGVGGVRVFHDPNPSQELGVFDTAFTSATVGENTFGIRDFASESDKAQAQRVADWIAGGLNAVSTGKLTGFDDSKADQALKLSVTSEIAAVLDLLSSVECGSNAPITQAVYSILTQMLDNSLTISDGVAIVDLGTRYEGLRGVIDPRILLGYGEMTVYTYSTFKYGSTRLFEEDGITELRIVGGDPSETIISAVKDESHPSIANYFAHDVTITSVTSGSSTVAIRASDHAYACDVENDPWIDKAYYPFTIPSEIPTGVVNYTGSGTYFSAGKQEFHVAEDGEFVIPDLASRSDAYPQMAANHLAMEVLLFAGEKVKKQSELQLPDELLESGTQAMTWSDGLQYGRYSVQEQAAETLTMGYYDLNPYEKPTSLAKTFKASRLYKSIAEELASLLAATHSSDDKMQIRHGSSLSTEALRTYTLGTQVVKITIDPTQLILTYGSAALNEKPSVPTGFVAVPLPELESTQFSPVYVDGGLRIRMVLYDVTGTVEAPVYTVVTEGSFALENWPDLAFADIYDYLHRVRVIVDLASKDLAAGDSKFEPGRRPPENWWQKFLDWISDLLSSKWLWIIIAIIVAIIVLKGRGGNNSTTIVMPSSAVQPNVARPRGVVQNDAQTNTNSASRASDSGRPTDVSDFI